MLLRWYRQGFKLSWKYKSRAASAKPKISTETVVLIKEMAKNNRIWGAERIRGELLKLGLHVSLPHHPEVHETQARRKATRTEVEHLLILHEKQLQRVLNAYVHYFNRARPHQGIRQQIPEQKSGSMQVDHAGGKVLAFPILGGLPQKSPSLMYFSFMKETKKRDVRVLVSELLSGRARTFFQT